MKNIKLFLFALSLGFQLINLSVLAQQAPIEENPKYSLLSPEEKRILKIGRLSSGKLAASRITGLIVGFGIGHAMAHQYGKMGWVFTAGEGVAAGVTLLGLTIAAASGLSALDDNRTSEEEQNSKESGDFGVAMFTAGLVGFGILKLWETLDLFVRTDLQNTQYDELQEKLNAQVRPHMSLSFAPSTPKSDGFAGVKLSF